jgi:hypothetical protein
MELQDIINTSIGVVLSVMGWFARQLWDAVQGLKDDMKKLEIDLPNSYVKKVDLDKRLDKLEEILGKIHDKLDSKADK